METTLAKTERTYIKLIVGSLGGVSLILLLGWLAWQGFQSWEVKHLVGKSAGYVAGGELANASLSARRALQINPNSAAASRAMARIAELTNDRSELEWRRKVLDLDSSSQDDFLALARAALRLRDVPVAEKALREMVGAGKESGEYFAAMARLAELKNEPTEAERSWSKAVELQPTESSYRMQLALLRLVSSEAGKRAEGKADLENLRKDPKLRGAATRTLLNDGIARKEDAGKLQSLAKELQSYPEATFNDKLTCLKLLQEAHAPEAANYLVGLEESAAKKPAEVASLISWLSSNDKLDEALRYAGALPEESTAKWPVAAAVADAETKKGAWDDLFRQVESSHWAGHDFLRRAYFARALRGQDKRVAADQELKAAEKEISAQPQALLALTRLIGKWGWTGETLELLWSLTKFPETNAVALQELYQQYASAGDTPGLYRVLSRSSEVFPEDLSLQNNLALISLLLKADPERARKLATNLYQKEPKNSAFASTYAFSLYTQDDVKGALKVMEKLDDAQRNEPSVAAYYGIILTAAGEKEKAASYLAAGGKATLLPEEKALLAKARNTVEEQRSLIIK